MRAEALGREGAEAGGTEELEGPTRWREDAGGRGDAEVGAARLAPAVGRGAGTLPALPPRALEYPD